MPPEDPTLNCRSVNLSLLQSANVIMLYNLHAASWLGQTRICRSDNSEYGKLETFLLDATRQ